MNRITNRFGAANFDNSIGYNADQMGIRLERDMREFIKTHKLSPDEIIAFEHKMVLSVSSTSSEALILEAIEMRKNEKAINVEAVVGHSFANDRMKNEMRKSIRKTPAQWCDKFGVILMDPDGWDRSDSKCLDYPITQDQFIDKYQRSTGAIGNKETYAKWRHLFS